MQSRKEIESQPSKSGKLRSIMWTGIALSATLLVGCGTVNASSHLANPSASKSALNLNPSSTAAKGVTTTQPPKPVGTGYLSIESGEVDFVQWTNTGGEISGTMQDVTISGNAPNMNTASHTLPLTGSIEGKQLSISFESEASLFGTFSGSSFVLNFPQSDGTLAPITFSKATTAAFNKAVSRLEQQAQAANQTAFAQEALQKEESKISSDAQAVLSLISGNSYAGLPSSEAALTSDVASVDGDLKELGTDLSTTQKAQHQVAVEAGTVSKGQICGDAAGVSGDAAGVSGDAAAVSGSISVVTGDLNAISQDISELQSAFSSYQSDSSADPSFTPANAPTKAQVASVIQNANSVSSTAVSTLNSYIDQANAGVASAYNYASQAFSIGNCGQAPTAPKPLSHIS